MIENYTIKVDLYSTIMFLGIVQGYFLSFFYFKNSRNNNEFLYQGLWVITLTLIGTDILFSYTNIIFSVIYLVDISEPLNFLAGPFFYLYVKSSILKNKTGKQYFHFIPAVFYFIYRIPLFFVSNNFKYNCHISAYRPDLLPSPSSDMFYDFLNISNNVNYFTALSVFIYMILVIRLLLKNLANRRAPEQKNLINEIYLLLLTAFLIVLIKAINPGDEGDKVIIILLSLIFYYKTYVLINTSSLFLKKKDIKYKNSPLSDDNKQNILRKIIYAMEKEKFYLNSEATLVKLSEKTDISPNYISQVVNECLNKSFNDLIAGYRIEEAKELLLNDINSDKIESIAYQVGYNSKSAFNNVFKKITGNTPSEFRKNNIK